MIEKYNKINSSMINFLMNLFKKLPFKSGLKISDCFHCISGGTFKSSEYVEFSKNKLITIKNINSSGFDSKDVTYLSDRTKNDKYLLNIGDILLTMTGAYLGRSGIVDENNCYQNQRLLKIDTLHKAFTFCFLRKYEGDIFLMGKGSAQPNLSLSDFNSFPVNYDYEDIINFDKYNFVIEYIVKNKIKIKRLNDLKNCYLKKFFG